MHFFYFYCDVEACVQGHWSVFTLRIMSVCQHHDLTRPLMTSQRTQSWQECVCSYLRTHTLILANSRTALMVTFGNISFRSPKVHEMNVDLKPTTNVKIKTHVHQLFKIRVSALADAAWASTLVVPCERGTCGSAQLLHRGEQGRTHSGLYRGGGAAVSLPSLLKLFTNVRVLSDKSASQTGTSAHTACVFQKIKSDLSESLFLRALSGVAAIPRTSPHWGVLDVCCPSGSERVSDLVSRLDSPGGLLCYWVFLLPIRPCCYLALFIQLRAFLWFLLDKKLHTDYFIHLPSFSDVNRCRRSVTELWLAALAVIHPAWPTVSSNIFIHFAHIKRGIGLNVSEANWKHIHAFS